MEIFCPEMYKSRGEKANRNKAIKKKILNRDSANIPDITVNEIDQTITIIKQNKASSGDSGNRSYKE